MVSRLIDANDVRPLLYAINVKMPPYSAVGDGVADDTSKIQAAIDASTTAGHGLVYFPKGTYLISSSLTPVGRWHGIQGEGCENTKILTASNTIKDRKSVV